MDNILDYDGLPYDLGRDRSTLGTPDVVNVLMAILAASGGGGGGGDASAENQLIEIARLETIATIEGGNNTVLNAIKNVAGDLTDGAWDRVAPSASEIAILKAIALSESTGNTSLASIDGKMGSLGQKVMTGSMPVVIASNQSAVPISASALPLPAGAATAGNQATANTSLTALVNATGSVADAGYVPNNDDPANLIQLVRSVADQMENVVQATSDLDGIQLPTTGLQLIIPSTASGYNSLAVPGITNQGYPQYITLCVRALTGTGAKVVLQGSNDNATWFDRGGEDVATMAIVTSASGLTAPNTAYTAKNTFIYNRFKVTTTSGNFTGTIDIQFSK